MRAYLYTLFSRVLGGEPDAPLLDELFSSRAAQAFALAVPQEEARWEGVSDLARGYAAAAAGFVDLQRSAYTRLFVGPGAPVCPPWESFQPGGDGMLLGSTCLEVRRAYARRGFRPRGYPHVADDHVAIELDFVASLAREPQDGGEAQRGSLACQRAFLHEHLGHWTDAFADSVSQADSHGLYGAVCQACAAFVKADAALLEGC